MYNSLYYGVSGVLHPFRQCVPKERHTPAMRCRCTEQIFLPWLFFRRTLKWPSLMGTWSTLQTERSIENR